MRWSLTAARLIAVTLDDHGKFVSDVNRFFTIFSPKINKEINRSI